jgi:hypothetical protein
VTAPPLTKADVTPAVSPSTNELNPEATFSGLELCQVKNWVCLNPGHLKELTLNWDIHYVHVGDEKLIEVTPEQGDNRKLIVKAIGITSNDEEKRERPPFTYTNFYVFGTQNQKDVYEVLIRNYSPRSEPIAPVKQPIQPITPSSKTVEIHNQKILGNSTNYECGYRNCKLSGGSGEAPSGGSGEAPSGGSGEAPSSGSGEAPRQ